MKKIYLFIISFLFLIITTQHSAKEILIYANSINYDSQSNIIGKGNVKIISGNEIIMSDLIIINEETDKITLPVNFSYKDNKNNYYFGSSGEFTKNFENGTINDVKILLNDGSRIVGKKALKTGKTDLINKGVYSPCSSKIQIKNFICPVWQVESEKLLHDREKLFLFQKHAKMRILNVPVFYLPYIVSPSPLRKKRKSGFLNPSVNFNFLDTKTSQSITIPYYFVISEDKEMLLTPTINYGGGVDASQRIISEYDQLISGGAIGIKISTDTNLENDNNESWLRDASIITNFDKNLNEKFKINLNSAFQTSPTYLRRADQNNILNRKNSLNTSVNLDGYYLKKIDDHLNVNISGYQVIKNNEDNKTTPVIFPYIRYSAGTQIIGKTKYNQKFSFYNIFRDLSTNDHAQQQQKIYHNLSTDYEFYRLKSKINFKTELISQFYNIENKKISGNDYNGTYARMFPMSGLSLEAPLINRKRNMTITPKLSLILNGSQPSSDKVSNEESTNNSYSLLNTNTLNRYTGTDKLDNSKRINYGIDISKDLLKLSLSQSYEFDANSNYNKDLGLNDYMSDVLGSINYDGLNNDLQHNFRFNVDQGLIKSQSFTYKNANIIGTSEIKYSQERVENNSILESGTETLDINFSSNKFFNYSKINLSSTFDLIKDDPTKYKFGYSYFDECFGVNLDFNRSFYSDRDLKPADTLTLMFSFKYLGSYKSTNLAVSEIDKQDIQWESGSVDEAKFD
ncbi:MAG: LPS-assembly protein LptD [Pelagibacteraceae bacterium]|nr:LPS-assembly protein LptD [Pelagibacteraceae bacterium]